VDADGEEPVLAVIAPTPGGQRALPAAEPVRSTLARRHRHRHGYPNSTATALRSLDNTPPTLGDAVDAAPPSRHHRAHPIRIVLRAVAWRSPCTTDYLKTRKQFGVTLNKFQALTARAADMYVSLELAAA